MLGQSGVLPLVSAVAASSEQRAAAPAVHGAQVDAAIRAALMAARTGGIAPSPAASVLTAARGPAILATSLTAAHSFSADVHRSRGAPSLVEITENAFRAADARMLAASGRGFDGSASGGGVFGSATFASTAGSSLALSGLADRTARPGDMAATSASAAAPVPPAALVDCPLEELPAAAVHSAAGLTAALLGAFAGPAYRVEPAAAPHDPSSSAGFGAFGARADTGLYSGIRYFVAQTPRPSAAVDAGASDGVHQVALTLSVRWPSLMSRLLKLAVVVALPAGAQLTARPLLEAARADLIFMCRALDGCTSSASSSSGGGFAAEDPASAASMAPGPAIPGVVISPGWGTAAQQLLDSRRLPNADPVTESSDASLPLLAAACSAAAASAGADAGAAPPAPDSPDRALAVLLAQSMPVESFAVVCEGAMMGVDVALPEVLLERLRSGDALEINLRPTLRRATSTSR